VFEAIRRQTEMLSQMQYLIKDLKVGSNVIERERERERERKREREIQKERERERGANQEAIYLLMLDFSFSLNLVNKLLMRQCCVP